MIRIRLVQLDGGKLGARGKRYPFPNIALMKLAHWHKAQGHTVDFTRSTAGPGLMEPEYDAVYASAIFKYSTPTVERFRAAWPGALVGGTGTDATFTVEDLIGIREYEHYDYTLYPQLAASVGFSQRGCRLKCGFCVVPTKEGANRSVNSVADLWRGQGHSRNLLFLDNDPFGQPESAWRQLFSDIREGGFRACFVQGFNVRLITLEGARELATIQYRDSDFRRRLLYTAWDNVRQEGIFFRGIDTLESAGIPANHVMAYMLVGFDPDETMDRVLYRFRRMVDRGILPYPMVYDTRSQGPRGGALQGAQAVPAMGGPRTVSQPQAARLP
jgi:hypothetical protein